MLALAGYPLGLHFRFYDPARESPVEPLAERRPGAFDDLHALQRFADDLQLVTYEFENVPVTTARLLSQRLPVYPPPEALEASQNRLVEKRFLQKLNIPTPAFHEVQTLADLHRAVETLTLPAVLKTQSMGYDGKGQALLRSPADIEAAWQKLKPPLILESFVPFERELSILAVRSRSGAMAFYPLVANQHEAGILRLSLAPAPALSPDLQRLAEDYAQRVMQQLNYVGVLAIEFFQHQGRLLANEMAPRVHNSGHWTIEGADTSQFENHLRAILDWPLGATTAIGYSAMLNLIGTLPSSEQILRVPNAHLHVYGKAPRPERKLGHITVRCDDAQQLENQLAQLRQAIGQ